MEIVVIIVMLLVIFSVMLKMTYLPRFMCVPVGLVLALFVGENWEFASSQSKTQIADWLQNPRLMLDMAVLLTIDVFMQITFCILDVKQIYKEKLNRTETIVRTITLWIPGILIFPTLLAILVETIFAFPGIDFMTIAWSMAAVIVVVGNVLPLLLIWLIPEKDLRLELIFMINLLIAFLGIVATVNGRTAVDGTNSLEWQPLLGFILILFTGGACGYFLFMRKAKLLSKTMTN